MAVTDTDLTAADVVWDLAPLLPAPGDDGLDELLDRADAIADELDAAPRARRRVRRRPSSSTFMRGLGEVQRTASAGRAATSASTSRPTPPIPHAARACNASRSAPRRSAPSSLFFELEWAELPDERVEALLADDAARRSPATTCARCAATGRTC